jgi:hypothetical protein
MISIKPLGRSQMHGQRNRIERRVNHVGYLLALILSLVHLPISSGTAAEPNEPGQTPNNIRAEESTTRPALTKQLTQTVLFVYEDKTPLGSQSPVPGRVLGTAFLVGLPVPNQPEKVIPFIVTAKHVIARRSSVLIRYTMESSTAPMFVKYDFEKLRKEDDLWEHPEEGVDIIVFRTLAYKDTTALSIPIDWLASKGTYTEQHISPADRVVIPCLLERYPGVTQNYPILRDGSLSLITEEPVSFSWKYADKWVHTKQRVIFVNATFNEGFSGAPVFLWPGLRLMPQGNTIGGKPWLLGIVHGFQPQYRRIVDNEGGELTVSKPAKPNPEVLGDSNLTRQVPVFSQENSATGIIFPSWQILEILQSDKVKSRVQQLIGPKQQ